MNAILKAKSAKVLLGGTFNPVHHGHLRLAIELKETLGVASVSLMPCFLPVHREDALPAADRLAMLELAVNHYDGLAIETYEIDKEGPSYTIDTLRYFRQVIGSDLPLYFALGYDAFHDIASWKQYDEILTIANLVVVSRPDTIPATNSVDFKLIPFDGQHKASGHCYHMPIHALAISSTQIRTLVSQQQSIDFLVPPAVKTYIEQQKLYSSHI